MYNVEVYQKLVDCGIKPSMQRLAILDYLVSHPVHPTIEDVYNGLCKEVPTLSKTTVYNTLRMFSEHGVAQMITIDDHHICYDGNVMPHVHFLCKQCGKVYDLFEEEAPLVSKQKEVAGHLINEAQLYYKGICAKCMQSNKN